MFNLGWLRLTKKKKTALVAVFFFANLFKIRRVRRVRAFGLFWDSLRKNFTFIFHYL